MSDSRRDSIELVGIKVLARTANDDIVSLSSECVLSEHCYEVKKDEARKSFKRELLLASISEVSPEHTALEALGIIKLEGYKLTTVQEFLLLVPEFLGCIKDDEAIGTIVKKRTVIAEEKVWVESVLPKDAFYVFLICKKKGWEVVEYEIRDFAQSKLKFLLIGGL